MNEKLALFLETVDDRSRDGVLWFDEFLTQKGCKRDVKASKTGYVVSYMSQKTKRTIANFVTRKTGVKIRIYADRIGAYDSILNDVPEKMKKEIGKASVCRRLRNPDDCNPRCLKGFTFKMDGETYQRCRYLAFMPTLNEENNPHIQRILENELSFENE